MTEINIILDIDFDEKINKDIQINDKYILFDSLNKELHIDLYNTYSQNKINYNDTLLDLINNDNYLEQINDINNCESDIKKIIIKKILEHVNPIIDSNDMTSLNYKLDYKNKNIIIDKNSISLNYPIISKYFKNSKKSNLNPYIIPANNNILVKGLFDTKDLYNHIPYKFNNFKYYFNDKFKIYDQKISNIYNKNINYFDKTLIDLNLLSIQDLKNLLTLLLSRFNLYLDNYELGLLDRYQIIDYKITENLQKYNQSITKYVNPIFSKNYLHIFNNFLKHQISDYYNNNIYFSFYNEDLLNLYENILIYSIDNKFIKNNIDSLIKKNNNEKLYKENQKILDSKLLLNYNLEYICKKKFPNLFNPYSKEYIFSNKKFNFKDLPKKYQDIVLLEYSKNNKYINEYNNNKCEHKQLIKDFNNSFNKRDLFNQILKLINNQNNTKDSVYKCILCSFNLICPHVIEYYTLLFEKNKDSTEFNVQQKILNKYMTNAPINMIYYCKVCGEELGKSLDLEQNIEFKDNMRINTGEYTDETLELITTNVNYIVRTYVAFNKINLNVTKKYIIDYIIKLISFYINQIEKKIRKIKNQSEEHIQNLLLFNIIIFIYGAIIFVMTKYDFIIFNQYYLKKKVENKKINLLSKDIIRQKPLVGGLSNNKILIELLKNRFKESFEIIYNTNNILINKLNYQNQTDKIKEILLKSYNLLNSNDELVISSTNFTNINSLLLNYSFIYKYLYDIYNIYPIQQKNIYNFSLPFFNLQKDLSNYSNNKNIKYDNYNQILNIDDINKKPEYLFQKYKIPIFSNNKNLKLENLDKITEINNYNEYKFISFLAFYYQIYYNLYELPIYEFIDNNSNKINTTNLYIDNIKTIINKDYISKNKEFVIYIKSLHLLKKYELSLINTNLIYYLYPYSQIKLNNLRYYYPKNISLNSYICLKDGFQHKYNIYIFEVNNKQIEINKKDLNSFINENKKYKFIDYKCNKCLKLQHQLSNESNNNTNLIKKINLTNNIYTFYNIFANKCPLDNYHIFKDNQCTVCKITFEQIFNKDESIFNKFQQQFIKYITDKEQNYNNLLNNLSSNLNNRKNINTINNIKNNININNNDKIDNKYTNVDNYQIYIDGLNIDDLYIKISNLYKIDIIYLELLGITEGHKYEELKTINKDYNLFNNRYIKIVNYIRTIFIYYNLLKNCNKITKYYDFGIYNILLDIQKNIKPNELVHLPNYNINIIDLYNYIKITNHKNYKYIIEFGLKIIYDFIIFINNINQTKFNNKLSPFLEFIVNKLLKFDELFTSFNYAQLKQMFVEDSPNFTLNNVYEEDMDNENEDDDELFGYNDLNINFEDEDPIDE
jgi:hypothetical protein